jgi:hypothetical protein
MSRGSKPGERRGGRAPGVPNKRTQELLAPVSDTSGATPKEVMLQAMGLHWAARARGLPSGAPGGASRRRSGRTVEPYDAGGGVVSGIRRISPVSSSLSIRLLLRGKTPALCASTAYQIVIAARLTSAGCRKFGVSDCWKRFGYSLPSLALGSLTPCFLQ